MKKLYISIEGQALTGVSSNDPDFFKDTEVVIIDYDIKGSDWPPDKVIFQNGEEEEAQVESSFVEQTYIKEIIKNEEL